MRIAPFVGVLAVCAALASPAIAAAPSCSSVKPMLTNALPDISIRKLSEAERERIQHFRPCIKTYPWPEGRFYIDTDDARGLSANEMRDLRDKMSGLIEIVHAGDVDVMLVRMKRDEVAGAFVHWNLGGGDLQLLERFGTLLVLQKLISEGRYSEAQQEIDVAFQRWTVSLHDAEWDEGDENTYFSRETQDNLFILLRFLAVAGVGASTRKEALEVASEYAGMRQVLADEISLLGDPAEDILLNAGCAE